MFVKKGVFLVRWKDADHGIAEVVDAREGWLG